MEHEPNTGTKRDGIFGEFELCERRERAEFKQTAPSLLRGKD